MSNKTYLIITTVIGAIVTLGGTLTANFAPNVAPYVIGIGGALNELVNIILKTLSDKKLPLATIITTIIGAIVTAIGTCVALWKPETAAIVVAVGGSLNEAINVILQIVLKPKEEG